MPTVTEVTFDPAIWIDGNGAGTAAGDNGYDAWTVYLDKDGVTFWAFEYDANGFARVNLSDGSIVHQDAFIPVNGIRQKSDAHDTTLWAQDASSHYYVIDGTILNKFHIAPGPAGNLMNGYCVVDGTFDLSTMQTGWNNSTQIEDMVAFNSGGVNYVVVVSPAFIGTPTASTVLVVNVDTMTAVGKYRNTGFSYFQTFIDKNNDIWFCGNNNATGDSLIKWHPADGATTGVLNVTVNFVSNATIGFVGSEWFTYVPASHSVFIAGGPGSSPYTSNVVNIDLTSFAKNSSHADDLTFFFQGWDTNQYGGVSIGSAAMDNGGISSGSLCIPGTVNPQTAQAGGIFNVIDPTTLTLTPNSNLITVIVTYGDFRGSPVYIISGLTGSSSYNLTSIINASSVPTKIRTFGGLGVKSVPFVMWTAFVATPPPTGPAGRIFKLNASQAFDDSSPSSTAINSTYCTYGFVNAAKSTQNPLLGFHRKRFSETQMYIKGSGQLTMKAFPNYILKQDGLTFNPYVYTAPPVVLQTDPIDDIVRPLNISGNRVFVMYSTNAVGAAFSISKTILCGNIDSFSTVNPNA